MKNILTIYKFNFPFLKDEHEKAKYSSICDDIKDELIYLELYLSKEIKNNKNYETHNIKFK
jgi:3-deoxy-D-arabino-heptulosonate 7-phosphate (DAHP) synthase class II